MEHLAAALIRTLLELLGEQATRDLLDREAIVWANLEADKLEREKFGLSVEEKAWRYDQLSK